jgi:hypothetical protein
MDQDSTQPSVHELAAPSTTGHPKEVSQSNEYPWSFNGAFIGVSEYKLLMYHAYCLPLGNARLSGH